MEQIEKLFKDLESNTTRLFEEAKSKLTESFNQTKEPWLLNNMMEYYLKTNSTRILEVLIKAQPPIDILLFDRLSDWVRDQKKCVPALTLFGFVIRKRPTWLYKVSKHKLMKDIFKLLQSEKEIVPLMSALLCIITLLPIIPQATQQFLQDLFNIFGYLAAWSFQNRLNEYQLTHLQLGLHMLFQRLYGMYPCNFLAYLKKDFTGKEHDPFFQCVIKPLLETVRIHPLIVTGYNEFDSRWKDVEPHDIVIECAKLSLALNHDFSSIDNGLVTLRSFQDKQASIIKQQPGTSLRSTPFQSIAGYKHNSNNLQELSPFVPTIQSKLPIGIDYEKIEELWSPQNTVLATPPPHAVPHTPNPSYSVSYQTNNLLGMSGSSPPEAAIEATPETTPLKDLGLKRSGSGKSHAARAILHTSQPSSPMRKERSPFSFQAVDSGNIYTGTVEEEVNTLTTILSTTVKSHRLIQVVNDRSVAQFRAPESSGTLTPRPGLINNQPVIDTATDSSREDEEVTELTSQKCDLRPNNDLISHPKMFKVLQNTSNQNLSRSRKIISFPIYCHNNTHNYLQCPEYLLNYGTNEQRSVARAKIRRTNSWPKFGPLYLKKRNETTQTFDVAPYEKNLLELHHDYNKKCRDFNQLPTQPEEILNQYIERSAKTKNNDYESERIQLLYLQLQYERYRRDIHAEHNRRLMGRSREKRGLELENDKLHDCVKNLEEENRQLCLRQIQARRSFNETEQILLKDANEWKQKCQKISEENKYLKSQVENFQSQCDEELKIHRKTNEKVNVLNGEIVDLQNELQHAQHQAELGAVYKQDLCKLESEFLIMGEIQLKCRDRFNEIDNLRVRDEELRMLQEAYNTEVNELKTSLDEKTTQLDSAKYRINELQNQLVNKEIEFTDQKRLLKTVKDEYEEKFKATNLKYDTQKTIILQMEQKIFELFAKRIASGLHVSSDSEKSDMTNSIERTSPLSTSLASSEGLSTSLRSVTELCNLQNLIVNPTITSGTSTGTNVTTSPQKQNQQTSNTTVESRSYQVQQSSRSNNAPTIGRDIPSTSSQYYTTQNR